MLVTRRSRRASLRTKLAAGVLAAGVVPLFVGIALTFHQAQVDAAKQAGAAASDRAGTAADRLAAVFQDQHYRLLLAADNDVLDRWYADPAARPQLSATLNSALIRIHDLDRTLTDEACFIDAAGAEQARMVGGVAAEPGDLSPDETGNPFFAPTMALAAGEVYQGQPYISPDSHRWVFPNSTPIVHLGKTVAMMHFETNVEGLRGLLASTMGRGMRARTPHCASRTPAWRRIRSSRSPVM